MARIVLIIGMVVSMLWSTSGVVLLRHYCGGELKRQGLYTIPGEEDCHHHSSKNTCHLTAESTSPKSCCAAKDIDTPPASSTCPTGDHFHCCEDEVTFLAVEDQYISVSLELAPPLLDFSFPLSYTSNFPPSDLLVSTNQFDGHPPERIRSEAILFQVFRL